MATYHFLFEDDTETATDMLRHVIRQDPSKFRYYLQQTHLRCGRLGDLVRRILREENLTGVASLPLLGERDHSDKTPRNNQSMRWAEERNQVSDTTAAEATKPRPLSARPPSPDRRENLLRQRRPVSAHPVSVTS
mmetsp:Transcript_53670/g.126235  ORF Transcript_53670/g.126235 Transcript_53670/m.126235 type:complete len:135 (-) Transcript_53670:52-456(-)